MRKADGQKDPVIFLLRSLCTEEGRKRECKFFAESEKLVERAFSYDGEVENVILTDKYAVTDKGKEIVALAGDCDVVYVTCGLMAKIVDAKPVPECVAICRKKTYCFDDMFSCDNPFVMMVENCENADNLGMLLRSCDACGVSGVILVNCTDPYSRRCVRGSRGAVFSLKIAFADNSAAVIEKAKSCGITAVATTANTDKYHMTLDYTKPVMLIVGNEHTGISEIVKKKADEIVKIPMLGKINSLNISVAASIMMYEVVSKRLLSKQEFARF